MSAGGEGWAVRYFLLERAVIEHGMMQMLWH